MLVPVNNIKETKWQFSVISIFTFELILPCKW